MTPRPALATDLPAAARLWHDVWHETHAPLMPPALAALRTHADFATRLSALRADLRVAGPKGAPVGFCAIRKDEMHQLFLAPEARGTGVAARLLADAETRLADRGYRRVWLDCAIGNDPAIRFYERHGWQRCGIRSLDLQTIDGPFRTDVLILEKHLTTR